MNTLVVIALCSGLLVGSALGAVIYRLWQHTKANAKMRLPSVWPLTGKVLMTSEEQEVFNWLRGVFHDHLVMVKVSVLRFTVPISKSKNGGDERWQAMLAGVHCTFTVCTPSGVVVGCLDVPGKRGMSKRNQDLKETLLSDCRIAYTVARSFDLPRAGAVRAAFLGEPEVDSVKEVSTLGGDSSFNADIAQFSKEKRAAATLAAKAAALKALNQKDAPKPIARPLTGGFNPERSGGFALGRSASSSSKWDDSFAQPDDSRAAKLNQR